jgi:CHAT domain-containing protein/Flp pilus assembly protein TadD
MGLMMCLCWVTPSSVVFAQTSPPVSSKIKADPHAAERFYEQGEAALEADNYAKAIALLKQAVERAPKNVEYQTALADAHFLRAEKLGTLFRWNEAIREYEDAYILNKINNRFDAASALNNIGLAYKHLNRYEKALEYYNQALSIFREVKNQDGEADTLTNIGVAYFYLSQYRKALEYYNQALFIFRKIKNRGGEADSLHNIGLDYDYLSQYQKALDYFNQSLPIYREIGDRGGEASAFVNIGQVYYDLSQYQKALDYFNQSLLIYREVEDWSGEAGALVSIGQVYNNLSQYQKALDYFNQSLLIYREVKNRGGEAGVFNNIGITYDNLGQYGKALEYYNQALPIFLEVKNQDEEANVLSNIGYIYYSLSQYERASEYYNQSLFIFREIGDQGREAAVLSNLELVSQGQNHPALAIFYGKQAVNAYQDVRGNIRNADKDIQKEYLKSHEDTYRTLADLLITQGRIPEAEAVLGLLKEEEYFEFVRRDATHAGKATPIALTPDEQVWVQKYEAIATDATRIGTRIGELDKLKRDLTPVEESEYQTLQTQQQAINERWKIYMKEVQAALADRPASEHPLEVNEGLQRKLADLEKNGVKAAVVYTLVASDKYYAILLTAHTRQAFNVPASSGDVNAKVAKLRAALTHKDLDPRPAAQEMYQLIFCNGQLENALKNAGADTVLWSLDGTLRYIPLAALYDGKEYLVETPRRNVVVTPESLAGNFEAPKQGDVLALGTSKEHTVEVKDAAGQVVDQLNFSALDKVPDELRGIVNDKEDGGAGPLQGIILLDGKFTAPALQRALRPGIYSMVHIASHFNLAAGDETHSFLLLGDGSTLSLAQWDTGMNLNDVDLLTLSACETAVAGGQTGAASQGNGAEVDSLGELAQRRGAAAVLASLWPVDDSSTSQLMQEFYKNRQAHPEWNKAEALRQAQLQLMQGEYATLTEANRGIRVIANDIAAGTAPRYEKDPKAPFAHPYYWAPFILMGNWR